MIISVKVRGSDIKKKAELNKCTRKILLFCIWNCLKKVVTASQEAAQVADHHSLIVTQGTLCRNCHKSSCESQNIIFFYSL